jgi:hypothetical protein
LGPERTTAEDRDPLRGPPAPSPPAHQVLERFEKPTIGFGKRSKGKK